VIDDRVVEIRHTIGTNGNLDLRNVSGRVRLVGIDGDEAVVLVRSDRGDSPQLTVERGEGSLLVEPRRKGGGMFGLAFDRSGGLDFDVHLPRRARLDVKTVSGDIDGSRLAGEQQYKTVSADVRLTESAGRISFLTVSGDVRVHGAIDIEVDGATTSGDVTIEARSVHRLAVRTVSGDVRIDGRLQAGERHSVETVSGDLLLELVGGVSLENRRALDLGRKHAPATYGDGSARLSFRSMSGEASVSVRAGDPASPARSSPSGTSWWPTDAGDGPAGTSRHRADRQMEVLRALERGEIDVDEAARSLEAPVDA